MWAFSLKVFLMSLLQVKWICLITPLVMLLLVPMVCAEPSLRVGIYQNPPKIFLNNDSQAAGFYVEVLNHIAEQKAWQLEYIPCDWSECLQKLERGELDLMPDVAWSEEWAGRYDMNREAVLYGFSQVYAGRDDSIHSILDLDEKRIAVVKDSFQAHELRQTAASYNIHPVLVEVESFARVFELIEGREVDGGIVNYFVGAQRKAKCKGVETDIVLFPSRLHFAAPEGKHTDILALLDEQLVLLKKDKASLYYQALLNLFQPLPEPAGSILSLTDEEWAWLAEHKTIRVGADPSYPPFGFFNAAGKYSGMGADYLTLLGKRLGIEFKIRPGLTWKEVVQGGKDRTLDLIPVIANREKHREFLNFTAPYLFFPAVIMMRKDAPSVSGLDDLAGKTIAVSRGDSEVEMFTRRFPAIKQLVVNSPLEELQAVAMGKADGATGNVAVFSYLMQQNNIANLKVAASAEEGGSGLTMGIRNDWPEFAGIIAKTLDSISQKEHSVILSTWGVSAHDMIRFPELRLTAEEELWLQEHPVLRVAVTWNVAPLSFVDEKGKSHGISVDYLTKLKTMLGVKFELVGVLSPQELAKGMKNKEIDFIPSVARTPELERCALFTEPYISMGTHIFARDDVSYFGDFESLAGKQVSVVQGSAIHEWLKSNHPDIELFPAASIEHGLELVNSKDAVAFVGNVGVPSYYIGKERLQQIRVTSETTYVNKLSLAVRNDLPILVNILQKALDAIPQSEHAAIYNSWLSIKYEHTFNYRSLLQVLLVVAVVLLAFIYWNRRLVRAEAALQKANERLRDMDQLKSMFIASMSHELRTPLNSIIGFTGILLQNILGELNERQRDSLERVQKAGRHLLELITDVIDISRIEAGHIDACGEDFSLDDLLQEAIESVEPFARSKGLSMKIDGHGELILHTDRKRLLQTVLNYLSNAVKYTETGSVTVKVRENGADVEITVEDTGIGISEEECSTLFVPFERLDSHLSIKAGGTGLGLYLTKKIVTELLQGNIFMKSQSGKGSTFGLRIPKVLKLHCPAIAGKGVK